ncbi:MAG: CDP-alcohol phosphatidyltransferase family protein [Methanobacteriota archaeon]|jgi:phosphatidylglycerophosphate synthase|uniref:CDP-alcohol phosphatidyltransferase family protein n=1 Tax=Marine Group III euryarchaeote TaxID=2173149 RepID=A0A7J4GWU1_9ARCH|nr:MAG: CDP-alcohol phosphatidyltransferase family protein [Euryarchaeota archaeon]HIF37391.1 CDP-alcohol phosphatidyltransferase family protein [Marine Group III euryarchaeote]
MVADDYRDFGTKLLNPIAVNIPLGPMGISILSLVTAITAGYSFYIVDADLNNKIWLLIGGAMVFLTAVLDALDGIVARLRDLSSKRGDLVDHTLDRVADIIILGGIALGSIVDIEVGFAAIIGVLMLSYMGTQAQAVGAGREYAGLLGRADRLIVLIIVPIIYYFNQEQNYMELMCYMFAIVCTLSAFYRFNRIWAELKE